MPKPSILLVDDEEIICATIQYQLSLNGYDVHTALSGEEAVEKLEKNFHYDLIITDLMMGEKSGLDVFKKARDINPDFPVIIITGFGDSPLFNEAIKLEPCGYAFKPFSQEEILSRVRICLDRVN